MRLVFCVPFGGAGDNLIVYERMGEFLVVGGVYEIDSEWLSNLSEGALGWSGCTLGWVMFDMGDCLDSSVLFVAVIVKWYLTVLVRLLMV